MSLKEILKQSFGQTKSNIKFLAPFFLVVMIVSVILGWFGSDEILSIPGIISLLVTPVIYYAITKVTLKISRNEKADWNTLFAGLNQKTYLSFLIVGVLLNLAVFLIALLGGFVTFFIPLIGPLIFFILMVLVLVTFIGVIFFPYYRLIDQRGDFWSSIKYSFNLAKGKRGFLLKFAVIAFLLNVLGVLLLGVGLLFTIPLTSIAMAHIYDKLKINHQ